MVRVIYVYIELKRNSRDSRIRTFRINCKLRFIFTLSSGKTNFGKWKWRLRFETNLLEGREKAWISSSSNVYTYKEKKIPCKLYMRIVTD